MHKTAHNKLSKTTKLPDLMWTFLKITAAAMREASVE